MKKKLTLALLFILLVFGLVACGDDKNKDDKKDGTSDPLLVSERLIQQFPKNDTYYQIFVRSFADSNGDGIGDIKGITQKLDYIEKLGATGIWLTPIHPSPSYHGYEVQDYYDINPDFGTMEDLQELIDRADEKGIAIMLDMVFNHTCKENAWFQMGLEDRNSKYGNYYFYRGQSGAYETFPYTRDLNLENEDVVADLILVMKHYLDMGVKGFRMDAIKHYFDGSTGKPVKTTQPVFDTMMLFLNFKNELKEEYDNVYFVGEWMSNYVEDFASLYGSLDSLFNFQFESYLRSGSYIGLDWKLHQIYKILRNSYNDFIDAPFISNHDIRAGRLANNLSLDLQKLATSILLTVPGNPFIYYGQELGMKGSRYEAETFSNYVDEKGEPILVYDEYIRQPFLWGKDDPAQTSWLPSDGSNENTPTVIEQLNDSSSLLNHTIKMANLRKETPALRYDNNYEVVEIRNSIISYLRTVELNPTDDFDGYSQKVLVMHNVSSIPITVDITEYEVIEEIYGTSEIPAYGTYIVEVK